MTFCCINTDCPRHFYQVSKKHVDKVGLPIAYANMSDRCNIYQEAPIIKDSNSSFIRAMHLFPNLGKTDD
jgi:hypothetical protein